MPLSRLHFDKAAPIWLRLFRKHVLSKFEGESAPAVALALKNLQLFEKSQPVAFFVPPPFSEIVELPGKSARAFDARVRQAYHKDKADSAFLRKLYDAATKGIVLKLDVTGFALIAYRELWLELEHCPNGRHLKTRTKTKAKRSFGRSQWSRTLDDLRELPLH